MPSTRTTVMSSVQPFGAASDRAIRLLAAVALLATLLATLLTAGVRPAGAGAGAGPEAAGPITVQGYFCPNDYDGSDYLADCVDPVTTPVTITDPNGTVSSGTTAADTGLFTSTLGPQGTWSVAYGLETEGVPTWYYSCFDGDDVFRFDGTGDAFTADLLPAESLYCRLYLSYSSADPSPLPPTGAYVAVQVDLCDAAYDGDREAAGCIAAGSDIDIQVNGGLGTSVETVLTDVDGSAFATNVPAGEAVVTLGDTVFPRESFGVVTECFDTTTPPGTTLGTANIGTFDLDVVAGGAYFCQFYVTPTDDTAASLAIQVWQCPVAYTGDDYLNDCAPQDADSPVTLYLNDEGEFDFDDAIEGVTGDEGRVAFTGLDAGGYRIYLYLSERVNSFYTACFDVTSGEEVFLFDGGAVSYDLELAAGQDISCRWYVIPADLDALASELASASASVAPSATASSRPSGGAVSGLPNTGAGDTAGAGLAMTWLLLAGTAVAGVVAATFGLRRRSQ